MKYIETQLPRLKDVLVLIKESRVQCINVAKLERLLIEGRHCNQEYAFPNGGGIHHAYLFVRR